MFTCLLREVRFLPSEESLKLYEAASEELAFCSVANFNSMTDSLV